MTPRGLGSAGDGAGRPETSGGISLKAGDRKMVIECKERVKKICAHAT